MFRFQVEDNSVVGDCVILNRILRNHRFLVLDFNVQIGTGGKNFAGKSENVGHFARLDAMVNVRADPCLKLAGLDFVNLAAAVYESLLHIADLGDVKRDWNGVVVGKRKLKMLVAVAWSKAVNCVNFT